MSYEVHVVYKECCDGAVIEEQVGCTRNSSVQPVHEVTDPREIHRNVRQTRTAVANALSICTQREGIPSVSVKQEKAPSNASYYHVKVYRITCSMCA